MSCALAAWLGSGLFVKPEGTGFSQGLGFGFQVCVLLGVMLLLSPKRNYLLCLPTSK